MDTEIDTDGYKCRFAPQRTEGLSSSTFDDLGVMGGKDLQMTSSHLLRA